MLLTMQQCRNPHRRRYVSTQARTPEMTPHSADALDQLQFIRHTMESATSFTAVPGWGTVALGLTAIAAAIVARTLDSRETWVLLSAGEAVLGRLISAAAKVKKTGSQAKLDNAIPSRKTALSLVPPP